MRKDRLVSYLNDELDVEYYNEADGAKYNGVLVEGSEEVERIGLCTNCTFQNIETANKEDVDFVISHHGGWEQFDGESLDEKKRQLQEYDITWYIAHEPLDCADEYGVSAALADKMGIAVDGAYGFHAGGHVGRYGHLQVSQDEFLERLEAMEDYDMITADETAINEMSIDAVDLEHAQIGVIGGSGGVVRALIDDTLTEGCDVLITGNASFAGKYYAHEQGLAMILLEETSSERWGVYALGEHLKEIFDDVELARFDERNW